MHGVRLAGAEHATSRGDWWPRLALLAVVLIVAGHLVGTGALVFGRDLVLEQVGQPLAPTPSRRSDPHFSPPSVMRPRLLRI